MRRLTILFLVALPAFAQVAEKITVERIMVDARVTELNGEPVMNLRPDDFRVTIDGRPASVLSVEWIPETITGRDATSEKAARQGRSIVYLFQTDFTGEKTRIRGYPLVDPR